MRKEEDVGRELDVVGRRCDPQYPATIRRKARHHMLTMLKRFFTKLIAPSATRREQRLTSEDYAKQLEDEKLRPKMRGN